MLLTCKTDKTSVGLHGLVESLLHAGGITMRSRLRRGGLILGSAALFVVSGCGSTPRSTAGYGLYNEQKFEEQRVRR
jgi:hypothetical protein